MLDALGLPHELGTEVTITYEINPLRNEVKTDTFQLCGYWEADKAVLAQIICYPKITQKKTVPLHQKGLGKRHPKWRKRMRPLV